MSSPPAQQRPPQVSFAAWMIIGGSVIVLLGAFEAMSSLRTLQTREGLEAFLAEPPGSTLGIGFEGARELRRIAILVSAASAVAAAILGIHVLKRNPGARVGLSVLAFPIFIAGSIAGGFASAVVTVAIVMLWLEPSRSWYAGRPIPERFRLPRDGARSAQQSRQETPEKDGPRYDGRPYDAPRPPDGRPDGRPPQVQQPWGQPGQQGQQGQQGDGQQPGGQPWGQPGQQGGPAPYQGFGSAQGGRRPEQAPPWSGQQHPGQHPGQQWPAQQWPAQQYGGHGGPARPERPALVVAGCILTWVCTGLVGLGALIVGFALAADPGLLDEAIAAQPDGFDASVTTTALGVFMTVVVVWSVGAAILAVFAFRGAQWARVALMVSAGAAAGFSLLGAIQAWPLLLFVAAGVFTIFTLTNGDASRWYAARGRMLR